MNECMMTDWEMGWVQVGLLWDKQHETLKFGANWANIEQDTAIWKLENL